MFSPFFFAGSAALLAAAANVAATIAEAKIPAVTNSVVVQVNSLLLLAAAITAER